MIKHFDPANWVRDNEYPADVLEWLTNLAKAMNEVGTTFKADNGMVYNLDDVQVLYKGATIGIGLVGSEFGTVHAIGTFRLKEERLD